MQNHTQLVLFKKSTIAALAIALGLDLRETERFLMKAGYIFSNSIYFSNSINEDLIKDAKNYHKVYRSMFGKAFAEGAVHPNDDKYIDAGETF